MQCTTPDSYQRQYATAVDNFRREYRNEPLDNASKMKVNYNYRSIENYGFLGSHNVVSICCTHTISQQAPGCIAAPVVHMVARESIKLGTEGQGDKFANVRIFAPEVLTVTTDHLFFGNVTFFRVEKAHITCRKLTFYQRGETPPMNFEVVRNWLTYKDTQIKTVYL